MEIDPITAQAQVLIKAYKCYFDKGSLNLELVADSYNGVNRDAIARSMKNSGLIMDKSGEPNAYVLTEVAIMLVESILYHKEVSDFEDKDFEANVADQINDLNTVVFKKIYG